MKIVEMLENQIVAKKRHLLQLERLESQLELQNIMELPNDWLQKGNMKLNKAGKECILYSYMNLVGALMQSVLNILGKYSLCSIKLVINMDISRH
jgi:hypothetical protein